LDLLTTDARIREALLPFIRSEHPQSDTVLLEEFSLYGGTNRADVAALNGVSHGYEIKSDKDTLARLPDQVAAYSAVFDFATLVTTERHLVEAAVKMPNWWGVIEVRVASDSVMELQRIRPSIKNPAPITQAIAALLWRPEALRLLEMLGMDKGVRSKPMEQLIERLAVLPAERLSRHVRDALRARGDWRAAARLRRYDAKYPRRARLSGSRAFS
jgi:hypothetical protein